jgi:hypothetical protein
MATTSNSLGGLSVAIIGQGVLKALLPKIPLLTSFATSLSSEIGDVGESVSTRVPSALTAVDTLTYGYSGQSATSAEKKVTLNQLVNITLPFNDKETTTISWNTLQNTFIAPLVNGIVDNVMSGILVNANYSSLQ